MVESEYQAKLIKKIKNDLPGCDILKNDSSYIQGIPDLSIFYGNKYAMLEVKKSSTASHQVNQDYYIQKFDNQSFGRFIYPENEKEVLDALYDYLNK